MNPNATRERALFDAAVQIASAVDRTAFLRRECAGDDALLTAVEALLKADTDAAPEFLESPPGLGTLVGQGRPPAVSQEDEAFPRPTMGRYKLLDKIGEGGCGVVYVAEQTEPVRRRVALKVIKLGMDTKAVIARFEAERQALAMMDHPNIAKVLDGGTTDQGRPYFAMELVRGAHLTDYCNQVNLDTKGRLDLFIKVCHAIQHAHQKGVIHRDIKPSNILVTLHDGVPVPKVIDFGIAKATEGRLTEATVYTQLHQFVGTPAYMSPEQMEMSPATVRDIDTRSDIYSLGVVLYELLAGITPFDTKELVAAGLDQMRKTIREKKPSQPSRRLASLPDEELTTTAKRRAVEAPKLIRQLIGDLDWIVMKCLEKDRTRRYETANGLAADIQRHLNTEPVLARPPSRWYEFQKTVRRHKVGFAAATAVILALAVGITVSVSQAIRATRAKGEAQLARQAAVSAELAARQRAYGSDMLVASHAFAANNLGRALDLLNRQRPVAGQSDLRGWEWRYLWKQVHSDGIFPFPQESAAEAKRLAVSPDSKLLAVELNEPSYGGGLVVKSLPMRQEMFRVATNEIGVQGAFSPTDPLLAYVGSSVSETESWQVALRLRHLVTGQTTNLPIDAALCLGLIFAQDGRTLLTSTARNKANLELTLWRIPEGEKLVSYPKEHFGNPVWHSTIAATADLSLAAYAYGPGPQRICVKDLRTGQELWTAEAARQYVGGLAFSPDGRILASGAFYSESDIRLWDVAAGHEIGRLVGHSDHLTSVLFSPDGRKLFSSSADQTIRVWDVASRTNVDVLRGHRREVKHLTWMPDGHTLVSSGADGLVGLWDTSVLHSRQPVITLPGKVGRYCFAPDSRSVLTLNADGRVVRWTGAHFQTAETLFDIGSRTSRDFSRECFSEDGQWLAAGSTNGVMMIWDVRRRRIAHQWTNGLGELVASSFLSNGKKLIAWSNGSHSMHYCDAATGRDFLTWPLPRTWRRTLAVSPDERECVTFDHDGEARLKNLTDGREWNLEIRSLKSGAACYSPDGQLLAANSYAMKIWNTATWHPVAAVGNFLLHADGLTFSPDGKRLARGTGGKEIIRIYDTESWQEVFTLEAAGYAALDISFSPDATVVGWLTLENSLCLARAPSWDEIHSAEAKENSVGR